MEVFLLSKEELKIRLLSDLSQINMPVDEVDLFIRPFSKTFYGRYYPVFNDNKEEETPINAKTYYIYIDQVIESVLSNLLYGAIFAVIVLFFFQSVFIILQIS